VPKGWKPIRLDSFIELAYGKALKSDMRRPGPVPVYGSGGITGWHDTALVKEASVVVGRKGTVGSIFWESRPFFPIDTVFYVKAYKPLTYCHQLLMTLGLNDMNTDAAVPGLNRENVYRLKVPDVPSVATAAFDDIVSALRRSINRNNDQAQTLSDARDALLPRLISGQHQLKGSYA
jgi:type I restriction enzyme S subunit